MGQEFFVLWKKSKSAKNIDYDSVVVSFTTNKEGSAVTDIIFPPPLF